MSKLLFCLFAVLISTSSFAQNIDVRILVKRKDKMNVPEQVFPDVGGFTLRQLSTPYGKASCPNASDAKGQLVCKVECSRSSGALRLYVRAPTGSVWPAVRGYSPPADVAIDILTCKLAGPQPIPITYKSATVLYGELLASQPELISAVTTKPVAWDTQNKPEFRSFEETASKLEKFSTNPEGRVGLTKLSQLSTAYLDLPDESKSAELTKILEGYAIGSKSVSLKGAVGEALGEEGLHLVKVSPKSSDYFRSITSIEKALGHKPSLSSKEVFLLQEIKSIKQADLN